MEDVSITLKVVFVIITLLTVYQFYKATDWSKNFLIIVLLWMFVQLLLGISDFYENELTTPPRFLLLILPPLILSVMLFVTKSGRSFLDKLDIKQLTFLHTIRLLVEPVLYFLFLANAIPEIMTFAGLNLDIISGLTAPVICYFVFVRPKLSDKVLIVWNILALGLLLNIVVIAILSVQTPFQQFGFEQPNVALASFPFNWLPSVVVPIVLLSHVAALRQLFLNSELPAEESFMH